MKNSHIITSSTSKLLLWVYSWPCLACSSTASLKIIPKGVRRWNLNCSCVYTTEYFIGSLFLENVFSNRSQALLWRALRDPEVEIAKLWVRRRKRRRWIEVQTTFFNSSSSSSVGRHPRRILRELLSISFLRRSDFLWLIRRYVTNRKISDIPSVSNSLMKSSDGHFPVCSLWRCWCNFVLH